MDGVLITPDKIRWQTIVQRSKKEKKVINITKKQFLFWYNNTPKFCVYCGRTESQWLSSKDSLIKQFKRLQIDRKIAKKTYSLNNIVFACPRCNLTKSDYFSYKQMLEIGVKYVSTSNR